MNAPTARSSGASTALMLVLVAVSAINPLAINMFVPAMPDMMRALGTDLASIQLVLSAYLFATAVAQLLIGPLSDRFGRRPLLIVGLGTFILASLVCSLAPSIDVLVWARVAQGAGGCAGIVLGRAIVRDLFERDRAASVLGYVTMGFAVAPMVGPAIGGLLNDHVGWRSIFGLQSGLGVLVLVAAALVVPETRRLFGGTEHRPGFLASVRTVTRIPAFWGHALNLSFGVAVFFCFLGGTPVIASDMLGMSPTEYGLYFAFVPGGFMLGNFLTARYSETLGISFMTIGGSAVAVVSVAAMGGAFALGWYHPLSLFLPMYGLGFANGLTFTNAIAGAVSLRPAYAGAASGLAGSLQVTGGALASVIIGVLLNANRSVFVMIGCMMVFALASLAAAVWTRTARQ